MTAAAMLAAIPTETPTSAATMVEVWPGQSIQSKVNAYPEGTAFLIKAGTHTRQLIRPKRGNSFIGERGAVLDGQNAATNAFVAGGAANVVIRGLRITRYAPPQTNGAVHGDGSVGWTVEDNEIDNNSNGGNRTYGLRIGSSWIVRRNRIHHNGWVGISGWRAMDTLIESNEVWSNPAVNFDDTLGEAANMKFFDCGRLTIRNNNVHDGYKVGIWLDTSRPTMTVEGNRVVNHGHTGIWYEVSYQGVIRNNYVLNAGYAKGYSSGWLHAGGIAVTNSPNVTVSGNTVVNSLNGIIGLQAASYANGPYGANEIRNLLVTGNTIIMTRGQTGVDENIGTNAVFTSWNIKFRNNRYQLGSGNTRPFRWLQIDLTEHQWAFYWPGAGETFAR